jgi:hypothetical protein
MKIEVSELRTYSVCPYLYKLNALIDYQNELQLACKEVVEKFVLLQLRYEDEFDFDIELTKIIATAVNRVTKNIKDERQKEQNINLFTNTLNIFISNYFDKFPRSRFVPITGHFNPVVQISNTLIELDFCGVIKDLNTKSIHFLCMLPNVKDTNLKWDLGINATLIYGKRFASEYLNIANINVYIHAFDIFSENRFYKSPNVMYYKEIRLKDLDQENKNFLISHVKKLEQEKQFLRIPYCVNSSCPKRKECQNESW